MSLLPFYFFLFFYFLKFIYSFFCFFWFNGCWVFCVCCFGEFLLLLGVFFGGGWIFSSDYDCFTSLTSNFKLLKSIHYDLVFLFLGGFLGSMGVVFVFLGGWIFFGGRVGFFQRL